VCWKPYVSYANSLLNLELHIPLEMPQKVLEANKPFSVNATTHEEPAIMSEAFWAPVVVRPAQSVLFSNSLPHPEVELWSPSPLVAILPVPAPSSPPLCSRFGHETSTLIIARVKNNIYFYLDSESDSGFQAKSYLEVT
jgi:hypothetical protein